MMLCLKYPTVQLLMQCLTTLWNGCFYSRKGFVIFSNFATEFSLYNNDKL